MTDAQSPGRISGAVLAGGSSRRMGRDKALIPFAGRPLVVHVAARLAEVCDEVFVVAKRSYGGLGVRVVEDDDHTQTPLAGIAAALRAAAHPTVAIVACDMPEVSAAFVARLAALAPDFDVAVPVHDGRPQTLHAVWNRTALGRIDDALASGERAVHRVLDALRVRWVPEEEWRPWHPSGATFVNVNTSDDLARVGSSGAGHIGSRYRDKEVPMNFKELASTAKALVARGRGILAADESTGTMTKRLSSIGCESTPETRRQWRELLFTAPGIGDTISGVILYDETIRQSASDGRSFVDVLTQAGVIPGIKVDQGAKPLALHPGELVTEGLDGLRERLDEYRELGARFTKWRAVITIGDGIPTPGCIHTNAHALGRYAALSQEAGLVPIVEPEVLMDGDHSIERCFEVTERTLRAVFAELALQNVYLEGTLLKPNMVISGKGAASRANPEEVADATIRCFKRVVPPAVPGCVFLSGGQDDEEATVNLDAMNRRRGDLPWELSFSYGRGLQATPLKTWGGDAANVASGQKAFLHRAKVTSAAREGTYSPEMEKEAAGV